MCPKSCFVINLENMLLTGLFSFNKNMILIILNVIKKKHIARSMLKCLNFSGTFYKTYIISINMLPQHCM